MSFFDILHLALRNLREAKLRAVLTTMGVVVGVAVIVTMVSFGLGLQRNTVSRFRELDLFNEITVYGKSLSDLVEGEMNRRARGPDDEDDEGPEGERRRRRGRGAEQQPARPLDDAALAEMAQIPGVASVEPNISFTAYVRLNGKARRALIGGALVPNPASRFKNFAAGRMIAAPAADEVVLDERFLRDFGYEKAADAVGQRLELLAPPERKDGEEEGTPNFFGIPLEEEGDEPRDALVARSFTVVGVLANELSGVGRRFRGI